MACGEGEGGGGGGCFPGFANPAILKVWSRDFYFYSFLRPLLSLRLEFRMSVKTSIKVVCCDKLAISLSEFHLFYILYVKRI